MKVNYAIFIAAVLAITSVTAEARTYGTTLPELFNSPGQCLLLRRTGGGQWVNNVYTELKGSNKLVSYNFQTGNRVTFDPDRRTFDSTNDLLNANLGWTKSGDRAIIYSTKSTSEVVLHTEADGSVTKVYSYTDTQGREVEGVTFNDATIMPCDDVDVDVKINW